MNGAASPQRCRRWLRVIAVFVAQFSLILAAQAQNTTQQQRAQATVDTLQRAAAAMERGDVADTVANLSSVSAQVALLEVTVERQLGVANAAMADNQLQLQKLVEQTADAYAGELAANSQARAVAAKYAGGAARMQQLTPLLIDVRQKLAALQARYKNRRWCDELPSMGLFEPRCANTDVWNDMRGRGLVGDIEDTTAQMRTLELEFFALGSQLQDINVEIRRLGGEAQRLQELREDLNRKEGVMRALFVKARTAKRFLSDLKPILRYRLDYPLQAFQEQVRSLVEEAADTDEPVVLDSRDVRQVESIRQSLQALAQMIEAKKSLLRMLENGALVCPPQPRVPDETNWYESAMRMSDRDWTRNRGDDRLDLIGAARCASPDAIYFGTVPSVEDCERKCKYDLECVMWTYSAQPDTGQCWGGSADLKPDWKRNMKTSRYSGARNDIYNQDR